MASKSAGAAGGHKHVEAVSRWTQTVAVLLLRTNLQLKQRKTNICCKWWCCWLLRHRLLLFSLLIHQPDVVFLILVVLLSYFLTPTVPAKVRRSLVLLPFDALTTACSHNMLVGIMIDWDRIFALAAT